MLQEDKQAIGDGDNAMAHQNVDFLKDLKENGVEVFDILDSLPEDKRRVSKHSIAF